jgi:hypothetical protein
MRILSCGAGMQSTALALMACENACMGDEYPLVPVYDAIIFCDLGNEAPWVYEQVRFIQQACRKSGVNFYVLEKNLYDDYLNCFGKKRVSSIPFWSVGTDGKEGRMRRHCTIEYKITVIQRFVKHELLGYRKYERTRPEDIGAHEMHIGFSREERRRVFDSHHPFFVNRFPLVKMGYERPDTYRYNLEVWGLDTKASACCICPFHTNFFFEYLKKRYPDSYNAAVTMDRLLEKEQPNTKINSKLYISRSRKRIEELTTADCTDGEFFRYGDTMIWNGF